MSEGEPSESREPAREPPGRRARRDVDVRALAPPWTAFVQRHGAKLLVSLLLGGGLAWVIGRGGFPLVPPRDELARLSPSAAAVAVSLYVVSYLARTARWRHLLAPHGGAPLGSLVAVQWLGFVAILVAPLRAGEVVRPYLLARRTGVRAWVAAGTVGAERVLDGLVIALVLAGTLALSTPLDPLPSRVGDLPVPAAAVPRAAYTFLAVFASALVVMIVFYRARELARRVVLAVVGRVSASAAMRVADVASRVADGLAFLPSARLLGPYMLETTFYWLTNIAGTHVLARALGLPLTWAETAVVQGVTGIGILIPAGPGFFGAYQLAAFAALAMYVPAAEVQTTGAVFVFWMYVLQVGMHLAFGLLAPLVDRDVLELRAATPSTSHADDRLTPR